MMISLDDLTNEERNAIRGLTRLAKRWPRSLWVLCENGTVQVMRENRHGERAFIEDDGSTTWGNGGVDGFYRVDGAGLLFPCHFGEMCSQAVTDREHAKETP